MYYLMAFIILILWITFTFGIRNLFGDSFGYGRDETVRVWTLSCILAIFAAAIVAVLGTVVSVIILISKLVYKIKVSSLEQVGESSAALRPKDEIIQYILEKQWVTVVAAIYAVASISFFTTNVILENDEFKKESKNDYEISEDIDNYKKHKYMSEKESETIENLNDKKETVHDRAVTTKKAEPDEEVISDKKEEISEEYVSEFVSDVSEIDSDNSVVLTLNSDKSINVEFTEAPCSLVLPASWGNNVVIREGKFYCKASYYNGIDYLDGWLFSIVFNDTFQETGGSPFGYIGRCGEKYCYYAVVTDVRVDLSNKSEKKIYDSMSKDYFDILDNIKGISKETVNDSPTENSAKDKLSPYLYGQISSDGQIIEGYTEKYVCNYGEKEVQWVCEDTWHITAKNKTYSYGIVWYECWDTDDGDYYGWIDGRFLRFYNDDSIADIDYYEMYSSIVRDVYMTYCDDILEYYLFDIDADGVSELLVNEGLIIAENLCSVYTVKNGQTVYCGQIPGTLTGKFSVENGALYHTKSFQGYQYILRVDKAGTNVSTSNVHSYQTNEYETFGASIVGCSINEYWLLRGETYPENSYIYQTAWVKTNDSSSGLNMRSSPDTTTANIITVISYGTEIVILEDCGDWYYISYDGECGYVSKEFVSLFENYYGYPSAWVRTDDQSSGLNMRAFPDVTLDNVITVIPYGAEIVIIEDCGDWYYASYNGECGYVYKEFVSY